MCAGRAGPAVAGVGALSARCPDIEVEVAHLPSSEQLACLRIGALDLALVHDPRPEGRVDAAPLYRGDRLQLFVPVTHRLAAQHVVALDDLAGEVLVVVPRSAEPGLHDRVMSVAVRDGRPFREVREAPGGDPRDLLFAVAGGRGIALAPRFTLRTVGDIGDAVAALELRPVVRTPDTLVAWSARGTTPALAPVHDAARAIARELYEYCWSIRPYRRAVATAAARSPTPSLMWRLRGRPRSGRLRRGTGPRRPSRRGRS